MKYDVVIVGGGASGLSCAVRLIRQTDKLKIAVVEAGDRLGKKLASTGNGQGNVTNRNMSADRYFGDRQIIEKIALSPERINLEDGLFRCMLIDDESGRVYPTGRQASALSDSLIFELKKGDVDLIVNIKVVKIDENLDISLSDGRKMSTKFAVLCVGGKAQKQFKTDGSSYALARELGHKITPLYPSLVQLKTDIGHIRTLKGIRVDCEVTAFCSGSELARARGDVIFTDYGISGNAVFAVSPYVADRQEVTISLNFLPYDDEKIIADIEKKQAAGYPATELLSGTLHNQLGRAIIKRCGTSDSAAICHTAKNFTLNVTGTLGFDYAQVTRGGVDMGSVTDELESKFVKNLFFAGEVLDVDGCCGGYNLHWAFASGYFVADSILKRIL